MKNIFFLYTITLAIDLYFVLSPNQVLAQAGCTAEGQCINNWTCHHPDGSPPGYFVPGEPCGSSQVGSVKMPDGIFDYTIDARKSGGTTNIGIIPFLSNLVQVFVIVAGIIAMFNFALAGYIFITSGSDPAAVGKVREKLTWTVIGLVFIVASYIAAGLIGLLFFDDASFILQPKLFSVLDQPQP